MNAKITPPSVLEADVKIENGAYIATPHFYDSGTHESVIGVIAVNRDDGSTLKHYLVLISGKTGNVSLRERSAPVKAALERDKDKPAKGPEGPAAGAAGSTGTTGPTGATGTRGTTGPK